MPSYPPSHRLARLVGPSLAAISLTEHLNAHIWSNNTPPVIALNGSMLFISGLAILLQHNFWSRDWRVLLTLIGWSSLGLGLMRMAIPERVLERVRSGGPREIRIVSTITAAVGGVLTLFGYFPWLTRCEDLGRLYIPSPSPNLPLLPAPVIPS